MKKKLTLSLIMGILIAVMAAVFTVGAAAETDPAIKVSALKNDGTTMIELGSYEKHTDGWSYGIGLAKDLKFLNNNDYAFIVIDILADWTAKDGEFMSKINNPVGFNWDTLDIPEKSRVMVNLNGHTIDRALKDWEYNGEVLCIGKSAVVVINGGSSAEDTTLGTIKGGFSCNGAGGIHINDKANVVLNNVCVVENRTHGDDGSGIAIYNGAKLVMNGGKLSNNTLHYSFYIASFTGTYDGAGIYVHKSNVELNNVELANNVHKAEAEGGTHGAVIGIKEGSATLNDCKIFNNKGNGHSGADTINDHHKNARNTSILLAYDSTMTLKNCEIYGNTNTAYLIDFHEDSTLAMDGCKIYDNQLFNAVVYHEMGEAKIRIENCSFKNEGSHAIAFPEMRLYNYEVSGIIKNCVFDNDVKDDELEDFYFDKDIDLVFEDCEFGDASFRGKKHITVRKSGVLTATLFGEGSLAIILAGLALVISIGTFVILVIDKRKSSEPKKVTKD